MRRLLTLGLSLSLLALAAAGCGSDLTSNELGPSGTVTETFAGTLNPGGGTTHVFVVSSKGTITATLTAVGDDNTRVVGLALGNYSNNACQLAAANDVAYVSLPAGRVGLSRRDHLRADLRFAGRPGCDRLHALRRPPVAVASPPSRGSDPIRQDQRPSRPTHGLGMKRCS